MGQRAINIQIELGASMTKELNEPVVYLYHDAESLQELIKNERKRLNMNSVSVSFVRNSNYRNETPLYSQGYINGLLAEIGNLKRGNGATAKLNYQKGYEAGSALTTYNKPAMERLQAEVEGLKEKVFELEEKLFNSVIIDGDKLLSDIVL